MSAEFGGPAAESAFMQQALALAALGEGTVSPNPRVGCVLVRNGRIVGRGYHRAPGDPHAEAIALAEAGDLARGATLYVNLEPCAHVGRTPPCSGQLIAAGIGRVVAGTPDPNPKVDGRGFAALEAAGIPVQVGLHRRSALDLNAPFMHWHATGRPLVTLKAAVSADGWISARDGVSRWITGPVARRFAHRMRLRHDAILVGAETVRRDDPTLDVRLAGHAVQRLRVVLSRSMDLDPTARVFRDADGNGPKTLVYTATRQRSTAPSTNADAVAAVAAVAEVIEIAETNGDAWLTEVLADLGRRGIQSLLIEGGGTTHGALLAAGLADRVALFTAPSLIGSHGARPLIDIPAVACPDAAWRLEIDYRFCLDGDALQLAKLVPKTP